MVAELIAAEYNTAPFGGKHRRVAKAEDFMPLFPGDEGYGEVGGRVVRDEDPFRTRALAMLQQRGIDLDAADQESPEFREMLSNAIVEVSDGLVKRAKRSEWGVDPWILDDLGLLNASEEEIEAALRKIEAEHTQQLSDSVKVK